MEIGFSGTKGRIVETALKLFSEHGYRGVSVRDIARDVGIKDSSIYSHFASKDDLLEAIIDHFRRVFLASNPPVESLERILDSYGPEAFFRRGFELFQQSISDPLLVRTYLVLMRERFSDNRVAQAWRDHEELVTGYAGQAFRIMVARKSVPEADPDDLARLFQTPIFHLLGEYIPLLSRGGDTSAVEQRFERHLKFFFGFVVETSLER